MPSFFLRGVDPWRYVDFFFFQAEDGIRDIGVTGVQTCALPICSAPASLPEATSPSTAVSSPSESDDMKLIRFGPPGAERPGLQLENGRRVDASAFGADYDEVFFGGDGLERLARWASDNAERAPTVAADTRLGPPLRRPSKIVCVGLNYRDHARESGMTVPPEPVIFMKATSAIVGPNDDVIIPRGSTKTDWEVELAIVIGKRASYVAERD